ncbi:MAG: DsbC family protein [Gammaproteobacteria bacterium]|nr:DsbC family protein [Gammaproteobacteria bacterium]
MLKLLTVLLIVFMAFVSGNLVVEINAAETSVVVKNAVETKVVDKNEQLVFLQQQIEKNIPGVKIDSIRKSKMPGFYEVMSSGQLLYVSKDAQYLISGKLFSISNGLTDLTAESMERLELKKAPSRREKINAINEKDMIVFKAADEKYRVTVFTDVDCSYCRKLHKEMKNYNKLGITVQYMGFPRAGIGSPSHKKLQTVWCADDPLDAMNKAKIDRTFGSNTCDDPLEKHIQLVKEFDLSGTPAIILKSGRLIPGFIDPRRLLAIVKDDETAMTSTVTAN